MRLSALYGIQRGRLIPFYRVPVGDRFRSYDGEVGDFMIREKIDHNMFKYIDYIADEIITAEYNDTSEQSPAMTTLVQPCGAQQWK